MVAASAGVLRRRATARMAAKDMTKGCPRIETQRATAFIPGVASTAYEPSGNRLGGSAATGGGAPGISRRLWLVEARQENGALDVGADSVPDQTARAVEEPCFGEQLPRAFVEHLARGYENAGRHRSEKMDREVRGQHEDVLDERVGREETGVVEELEVHRTVNGPGGVEEVFADMDGDLCRGVADANRGPVVGVRGRSKVQAFERAPVVFLALHGVES